MATRAVEDQRYKSFEDFYPFYLTEHVNRTSRRLHVVGTSLALTLPTVTAIATGDPLWLLLGPVIGYGFAWVGHFFFEKNRPATFTYPLWSLMGDFRLMFEVLTGRRPF